MGQLITVEARTVGDVALFDTNRSVTGQDGESYHSVEAATAGTTLPAELAVRLFTADPAVRHVFVMSNAVSASRDGGWAPDAVEAAATVIREFFVFYRDGESGPGSDD